MKILKFSAIWCPACLIMNSRINKVIKEYNFEIVNYDYDVDEELVNNYSIGDILPVMIITKENQEMERIIGEKSEKELRTIFDKYRK